MPDLDLAVVGNCTVASLIDRSGRHVWFGFPRLDGDPIFSALLGGNDPQFGFMDVTLAQLNRGRQRYLDNTAVVETVLSDGDGTTLKITDFCPRFLRFGRMFRPPLLVRRIEPLTGQPRITVRLRPIIENQAGRPASIGSNHVRFISAGQSFRVTTDMPLSYLAHEAAFVLRDPVTLFIGLDEPLSESPGSLGASFLSETIAHWRQFVRGLSVPFDWQGAVIRAAITLKLCNYEDTGGIVAALTTSIPEAPGSGRTWDYRYCWPRDAYYTVDALNRLSATQTMEGFVRYLLDTVQRELGGEISPLYPIAPGNDVAERIIDALPGYGGDGPVRVGNAAYVQSQNDVYGSIVLTAAQMFWDERLPKLGDIELYRSLVPIAEAASRLALEPDAGIWEYRGTKRSHTYSATMCWAAQHRMWLIARRLGEARDAARWQANAEALSAVILRRALTNEGWLSGVLDAPVLDASTLLLSDLGLLPASDPAYVRTVEAVGEGLMNNGFIMRYKDPDDFGLPETAFLVCTYWYIGALADIGRRAEALAIFENLLAHRNHVGLLSEDISPTDGKLWGNFPQTYSQVGLILAAMRLSRSWTEGPWRVS